VLKQSSASKDSKTVVAKSPKAPKKPAAASKSDD